MATLSKKQRGFVRDYLNTGNGTRAALANYNIRGKNKENIAASIAKENLTKPQIKTILDGAAADAMARIIELSMNAENENVRLAANKDILDRAGYKPMEKMDMKAEIKKELPVIVGMRIIDLSEHTEEETGK
jgi:phage terminase small subunit